MKEGRSLIPVGVVQECSCSDASDPDVVPIDDYAAYFCDHAIDANTSAA
jgi:hypothetical protein